MGLGDDVGAGGGQAASCWGLTVSPGLPPGGTHVQLEAAWPGRRGACSLSARACAASQTQALGRGLQGSLGSWCPEFSSLICEPRT